MVRQRADVLVVELGLAPNRSKARALILAGIVVGPEDRRIDKPGEMLPEGAQLRLKGEQLPFVSRGGLKLQAALDAFELDVTGAVALDVGASTGGFTDCLLQRGASRVYAVDVGYGQLDWSLRQDPRVVVIERANIRTLEAERIPEPCSVLVADVSFISLTKVLDPALRFVTRDVLAVVLVKPQFEVGPADVGKGGIVRDDEARARAVQTVVAAFEARGLTTLGTIDSPIRGAKGNQEYLLVARGHPARPSAGASLSRG